MNKSKSLFFGFGMLRPRFDPQVVVELGVCVCVFSDFVGPPRPRFDPEVGLESGHFFFFCLRPAAAPV